VAINRVSELSSREVILDAARAEFAERGFAATRLQDIGRAAGLSHPTLLYYFGSKEGLYAAVLEQAVADWAAETREAISTGLRGFDQVASLVKAGFHFFETHQDIVRIVRREAIEDAGRLEDAIAEFLRPLLDEAVRFLEREMRAGRLRRHDPVEVVQVCYAALSTYFSDAHFRAKLLGDDPLAEPALRRHRRALIGLLRAALDPAG
jgi:TetR/AcrR family transcriptional regulator